MDIAKDALEGCTLEVKVGGIFQTPPAPVTRARFRSGLLHDPRAFVMSVSTLDTGFVAGKL